MYKEITTDEAVLKCLLSAIQILKMANPLNDYQAILFREFNALADQLSIEVRRARGDEPIKDNVVEFRGKEDEDPEI